MGEEISACFAPLPRPMRSYSTPLPLGARWCVLLASSVWGAGLVAKRARGESGVKDSLKIFKRVCEGDEKEK